jgi:hypothetical protein
MQHALMTAALGLLGSVASLPAHGATCYQIWDRREVLTFQSTLPPFDLSMPVFERSMNGLRAQSAQLVYFDAVACPDEGSSAFAVRERAVQDSASQATNRAKPVQGRGIPASGQGSSSR